MVFIGFNANLDLSVIFSVYIKVKINCIKPDVCAKIQEYH